MKRIYMLMKTVPYEYFDRLGHKISEYRALYEFSGLIEIDGLVVESFTFKVKPYCKGHAIGSIINTSHAYDEDIDENKLNSYPLNVYVAKRLENILKKYVNNNSPDKAIIVGFGNDINMKSFSSILFSFGNNRFIWCWNHIDVKTIVVYKLQNIIQNKEHLSLLYSIMETASFMGISSGNYDLDDYEYLELVRKVYYKLNKIVTTPSSKNVKRSFTKRNINQHSNYYLLTEGTGI